MSAIWEASTAYVLGDMIRPTSANGAGLVFRCSGAGTSGSTEPPWPRVIGGEIQDGTVRWLATSMVAGDLQQYAPSAVIELFELEMDNALHGASTVYRWHAGSNDQSSAGDIVWNGQTYNRYPVEAEGFEYSGEGSLPRPKLRVSNVLGTITTILAGINATVPGNDLTGAKVTRLRTQARYLDAVNFDGGTNPYGTPDPTAEWPREVYYVDRKTSETKEAVEFELAAALDMAGVRAPKRSCIGNICQWRYKGTECGYSGPPYYDADDNAVANEADDVCGKRLSSCEARFASFTLSGCSVTSGSTTLTVPSTTSIVPGIPVSGFGLPANTTVVSVDSATTLTLSNAATASTSVTTTGYISENEQKLILTSTAGIGPGMSISGPDVWEEAQTVEVLDANNVSITFRPFRYGFLGQWIESSQEFQLADASSYLSVGDGAFGWGGTDTTVTTVSSDRFKLASVQGTLEDGDLAWFWFVPNLPPQETYVFTGDDTYRFRADDAALPFGSFPGIGTVYV